MGLHVGVKRAQGGGDREEGSEARLKQRRLSQLAQPSTVVVVEESMDEQTAEAAMQPRRAL